MQFKLKSSPTAQLHTRAKGNLVEDIAVNHLQQHGLAIIERNFSCRLGEIDIICQDQQDLVFVEVRYRKDLNFGTPIESINYKKQQKLKVTATAYIQAKLAKFTPTALAQTTLLQTASPRTTLVRTTLAPTTLAQHKIITSSKSVEPTYRFDIIGVSGNLAAPDIEWLQNVIFA